MKKLFYSFIVLLLTLSVSKAQTTAMDFTQNDCEGMPHHLFSELDSGNVIIMEFIMTCNSCIAAGHAIETMMTDLELQYPGKVRLYQIAYTNSYTCSTMQAFKTNNAFSSRVFDQGATMVAYYGGFGMPTVAIAAGSNHDVIYTNVGFMTGDTTQAGQAIRAFFTTLNVNDGPAAIAEMNSYPNPASDVVTIELNLKSNAIVNVQVVDFAGKLVREVADESMSAGTFKKELNVSSLSPGFYLLKATVDGKSKYTKINIGR